METRTPVHPYTTVSKPVHLSSAPETSTSYSLFTSTYTRRMESARLLASLLSWTVRAGCATHLVNEYIYEFTETKGESMLPTLQASHDFVHALKTYRLGRNLHMGDLVVATKPSDPDHRICKRITGMPGDAILVDPSSSSAVTNPPNTCIHNDGFNKYVIVPDGHVWVTGDNLSHSLDSRSYSWLPMGLIKGKVVAANSMDKGLWDKDGNFSFFNFRYIQNTYIEESNNVGRV